MITSIRLQHFRSYKDESFEFEPGVNIVVGPNASGKTNLLEAIYVLAVGGSYRARDIELLRLSASWARAEAFFGKQQRAVKLKQLGSELEKELLIAGKSYRRLRLEQTVPVVFFEPNHLQMITRGPQGRRDYIDSLLERSQADYKKLNSSYARALAQRNALLKKPRSFGKSQLFAWNIRLSELGSKVVLARSRLIADINKDLSRFYSKIAGHMSKVEAGYESPFPPDRYASRLLAKLETSLELDYQRGFTAYGPHREDVVFSLNKQPANQTASRGEIRSLVLALKIYELGMIEKARGQKPIFLLDDVFSELDGARRHALVSYLKNHQTIITTTDADAVVEHFLGDHKIIALGQV